MFSGTLNLTQPTTQPLSIFNSCCSGLEAFIRAKYEQKKYIAAEWVPTKPKVLLVCFLRQLVMGVEQFADICLDCAFTNHCSLYVWVQ